MAKRAHRGSSKRVPKRNDAHDRHMRKLMNITPRQFRKAKRLARQEAKRRGLPLG